MVAAIGIDNAIGANNKLCWNIPEDMQHFKKLTTGGVVIMGRKTFASIGEPLPSRINIVLTKQKHLEIKDAHKACNIIQALDEAKKHNRNIYIIGGGIVYAKMIKFCDTLNLTYTNKVIENADSFFPKIPSNFKLQSLKYSKDSNIYFTEYKNIEQ